ncbi:MAG: hypothetical protein FJ271_33485 [Planctomycetes bacterium]|nr:hypothetical protein [Planctomycetota bacterium]
MAYNKGEQGYRGERRSYNSGEVDQVERKGGKRDGELGALWSKVGLNGEERLTGLISLDNGATKHNLVCFFNRHKTADNQPTWRIFLSRPQCERTPTPDRGNTLRDTWDGDVPPITDDDLPF